jgi:hypothetical protein
MKKVFITLLCLSVSAAVANAQDKEKTKSTTTTTTTTTTAPAPTAAPAPAAAPEVDPNAGKFKFNEETHDFGEIPEGPLGETDFEFKNVGKKPIVITEAHGSCGCTVPSWPHDPILPKQTAKIHVAYTTNGRQGPINKDVIITSNAQQNPMRLHITGSVKPKPADPAPAPAPAPANK